MIRFAACVLALAGTAVAARAGELDREVPKTAPAPAVAAAPGGTELDQESPTEAHRYRGGWGYGGYYGYRPYYGGFSVGYSSFYGGGWGYRPYYGGFYGYRPVSFGFSVGYPAYYGGFGYGYRYGGFGPGCWF